MRTTLDIEERALVAARAKAAAERVSLGRAVSELILSSVEGGSARPEGFPMFGPVTGHVITDELVAAFRDDE